MRFIINNILLFLHCLCSLALLLCYANAYISPEICVYFNFLSLAFPLLVFFHLLFCIYWVFLAKKRAYYFGFILALLALPIYRWLAYNSQPESQEDDIKILSYNVKGFSYMALSAQKFINQSQADVVCLQETGAYTNQATEAAKLIKYPYEVHIDMASIYSKYPIVKQQRLLDASTNGHVLLADIKIKNRIYRIINVYLNPFYITKDLVKPSGQTELTKHHYLQVIDMLSQTFKIHAAQVDIIKKHIVQSPYPVVLAGDFNAVPNSYEYYQLKQDLKDAFVEVGRGSATTFHDFKFPLRIDYIMVDKNLKAVGYSIDRSQQGSDHYPVMAKFRLPKA
jgi:endonuclease/exonuclease/phosphatase (EEP) superfamily protein YafD